MLNFKIFLVLGFISFAICDVNTDCDQDKLIQYGSTICEVSFTQCSSNNQIQFDDCIGYKCKISIGQKCYYYSYQRYDKSRCMAECCGIFKPPTQVFTNEEMSKCFSVSYDPQTSTIESPSNKLLVVLGCVLGAVFLCIVIFCLCCRHKIKEWWHSADQDFQIQGPPKPIPVIAVDPNNDVKFILEQSCQNLNFDKEQQCTICLCTFNQIRTSCGHWFHLKCLTTWIQKNLKCPNCNRQDLNPITVICRECQTPYAVFKLNKRNLWRQLKKSINGFRCQTCIQKQK